MSTRRILSIWFPRLGAERLIRLQPFLAGQPLVIIEECQNVQLISSLNGEAQEQGLYLGQLVRDAYAMCPELVAHQRSPMGEQHFLQTLQCWAGKFSPWVGPEGGDALVVDLTGCAHLFGGEQSLMNVIEEGCTDLGLSVLMGLADTRGAAWALAHFAGCTVEVNRSGDAIDQEARATRSRAEKRQKLNRNVTSTSLCTEISNMSRVAESGKTYTALSPLPVASLRLEPSIEAQLVKLGLRCVGDLLGQPRAALARRFGRSLMLRLDQAIGNVPEPVSPVKAPDYFAVRITLPEPIGLVEDMMAGIDRLLPRLCKAIENKGKGARCVALYAHRSDHAVEVIKVRLAQPSYDPRCIRQLLEMKIGEIDAGFGVDMLRLVAIQVEPLHQENMIGYIKTGTSKPVRQNDENMLDNLIGRLGIRVGLDAIQQFHPASSHIPEKSHKVMAAAWSTPYESLWPTPNNPRPLIMWQPEPVNAIATPQLPDIFRWRGQDLVRLQALGPERIAPEWWLDDPNWRSGVRDYWILDTTDGQRLWLFYGHGGAMSSGWFCHGNFV